MVDSTRRRLLAILLGSALTHRSGVRLGAQTPPGGALPHLDEKDKMAVSFGYVADATKVDKAKNPRYKPDQTCANCAQLQGKAGDTWRPCKIFPGKAVNVAGWCKVWLKKPSV